MPKLHQINALVTGRKTEVEKAVGDIHKILQQPTLFNGFNKTYKPLDEEKGERFPDEDQKIQQSVSKLLEQAKAKWTDLWDLTATQDAANQEARANIEVDGKVVLPDVPVTTLLFLEKQVNDVESMVNRIPTPAQTEDWTYDSNVGFLKGKTRESVKTKKVPTSFEKSPSTKEHPAQVEFYYRDDTIGHWLSTPSSTAMPVDEKNAILARIRKLKDAIKLARENANGCEAKTKKIGEAIFSFVFNK